MRDQQKIVIIGCGNVAWHLAERYKKNDLFVYNHKRNPKLNEFKERFNATVQTSLTTIVTDADLYFVCVKDDAISDVIKKMEHLPISSLILITSGNFDIKNCKTKLRDLAIFYPLQTFSKDDEIKWKDTYIIVEGSNRTSALRASAAAKEFSKHVIQLNYKERLHLHAAAVYVNNFTNALYVEADQILKGIKKQLSIDLLYPLIKQGVRKLKTLPPKQAQTGPAKRGDKGVMQKHLSVLPKDKKELYTTLSSLIEKQQKEG